MTNNPIYAWHFSNGYLRFDKSDVEVKPGLILETDAEPQIEKVGFHACRGAHDALFNLSSRSVDNLVVSRVKLSGNIITADYGYEILVAQRREHLWVAPTNMKLEEAVASYVDDLQQLIRNFGGKPSPKADALLKKRRELLAAGSNIKAFKEVAESFKADMELGDFSNVDALEESSIVRATIEDFLSYVWSELFNKYEVYEDTRILELLLYPLHLSTLYFVVEIMTKLMRLAEKIYMAEVRKLYIRENEEELRETLLDSLEVKSRSTYSLYLSKTDPDAYENFIQQNMKEIVDYIRFGRNDGWFGFIRDILTDLTPYQERLKAQCIFKSPNEKLHEMLMQLAPEGYHEP